MDPANHAISPEGLNIAERILLVEQIWDSIATDAQAIPITDVPRDELDRRLNASIANPASGQPWEQVRARLEGGR